MSWNMPEMIECHGSICVGYATLSAFPVMLAPGNNFSF